MRFSRAAENDRGSGRGPVVIVRLAAALGLLAATAALAGDEPAADGGMQSLEFDVFLDDSRIGSHRYEIRDAGSALEVRSTANFDVKFLFISAFKYRHNLQARWIDDCLVELDAETNSNGDRTVVVGERTDQAFVVESLGERNELPRCVMTFAYWNPDFLEQPRLLNPQTGKYLDVEVEELGEQTVSVAGGDHPARGYTVRAKDYEVTVWYSTRDGEWLALESPARGGRTIRYELT